MLAVLVAAPVAFADTAKCQKAIVRGLVKVKRAHVKKYSTCTNKENVGTLTGPCPDALTDLKVGAIDLKVRDKIALNCTLTDAAALGFPGDCHLAASPDSAAETACYNASVTTPTEFGDCLVCWKKARANHFVAMLYPSHAEELCGGTGYDATSDKCSSLECMTPPNPDQRDLGNSGENDCQKVIARAGIKYLLKREGLLEKCGLAGINQTNCLADTVVQEKIALAQLKRDAVIETKCLNRTPVANPPFCCRIAPPQQCMAVADRDACIMAGGQVMENKTCQLDNTCGGGGGNQEIEWWETCAAKFSGVCGTPTALTNIDDVEACLDTQARITVDRMLCYEFRTNGGADWPCPTS